MTLNTFANMLSKHGRLSEAESLHREAAEIARKLPLGKEHDEFLEWSLGDLGQVLQLQGKLDEAEAYYREALAVSLTFLSDPIHKTDINLANLVDVLRLKGRYSDAGKLFAELLTPANQSQPQGSRIRLHQAYYFARIGRWQDAVSQARLQPCFRRSRKSAGCMGLESRNPCASSTLSQAMKSHISCVSTPSATTRRPCSRAIRTQLTSAALA